MQWLELLWRGAEGQDVIEYTLLLAFVVFATVGIFGFAHDSIAGIVNTSNSQIDYGNHLANGN